MPEITCLGYMKLFLDNFFWDFYFYIGEDFAIFFIFYKKYENKFFIFSRFSFFIGKSLGNTGHMMPFYIY